MTPIQLEVYDYIKETIKRNDIPPTYNEIQVLCGLSSVSQAYKVVDSLIKKGYLKKEGHGNRQLLLTDFFKDKEYGEV
jgi:SOS-response transcriptional repressor LexA